MKRFSRVATLYDDRWFLRVTYEVSNLLTLLAETAAVGAQRGTKGEAGSGGRPAARTLPATQGLSGRSVTMAARARLRLTAGCGRACTPRARRERASDECSV